MLLIAVHLFFNGELMAENPDSETLADRPIGIETYLGKWAYVRDPSKLGKWAYVRDPSKTIYIINNVDGHIVVDSLLKGQVVSNIKLNTHSLSFLRTSSEVNPLTGTPDSINVILIPDGRSNASMFEVSFMESAELQLTADTKLVLLMSRVKNGNNQIKGKTGISKEQSKRALENIYTKQWDLSELQCLDADYKISVQLLRMKNRVQAVFTHRGNKTQVPAKVVDNTVTISIDPNEDDDLKKIPIFRDGNKYHFQLIPLCGNQDHLILKVCSIKDDDTVCVYYMVPSIGK
ncbi:hypothetical protein [Gimesia sp.]|uniref:hypothetical protein n=1 Tax=Gimesia sp. TaxID=2024833 RepID=UPI003A93977C